MQVDHDKVQIVEQRPVVPKGRRSLFVVIINSATCLAGASASFLLLPSVAMNADFYPYHEPSLVQILVLSSFFVFLNAARIALDWIANVGILGELFVGLVYGTPLAGILEDGWESTFTAVGYLGLIILVLEGGLSTNLSLAKSNLGLSFAVAVTGILAPILLSLILLHLAFGFTLLQAFTAGAALSATSLGTTFSVISQAGFGTTRLGAVLTSAAVTDDVVGLILLQVVVSLGRAAGSADQASAIGWAVGRPLLASLALLGVSWFLTRFIVVPLYANMTRRLPGQISVQGLHSYNLLVAFITASAYSAVASLSGTSVLLGAFVAGLVLASLSKSTQAIRPAAPTFADTYEHHIHPVQSYVLRPLFFASVGYAVPIKSLFTGRIVWQGIVYSVISTLAKLVVGAFVMFDHLLIKFRRSKGSKPSSQKTAKSRKSVAPSQPEADNGESPVAAFPPSAPASAKPSLWPVSLLLGSAMVARGEISLLIANLAQVNSPSLMPNDLFYVTIWAIIVTTLIGPITVGIVVKRMQKNGTVLPPEWGHVPATKAATPPATPKSTSRSSPMVDANPVDGAERPVKGGTVETPAKPKRARLGAYTSGRQI